MIGQTFHGCKVYYYIVWVEKNIDLYGGYKHQRCFKRLKCTLPSVTKKVSVRNNKSHYGSWE